VTEDGNTHVKKDRENSALSTIIFHCWWWYLLAVLRALCGRREKVTQVIIYFLYS
jgi:hypothetical protein